MLIEEKTHFNLSMRVTTGMDCKKRQNTIVLFSQKQGKVKWTPFSCAILQELLKCKKLFMVCDQMVYGHNLRGVCKGLSDKYELKAKWHL